MPYYPIQLGVMRKLKTRSASQKPKLANTNTEQKDIRLRVFARDDHTCQCCGFRAEEHQELLHENGDLYDFSEDNLLTTCIFCQQCFDLELAGRLRSGVLIWLPEIAQSVLNHLLRSIYILRIEPAGDVPHSHAARQALDILMQRRDEARKRLGTDDPRVLATILQDFVEPKLYAKRTEMLKGLRLMPLDRRNMKDEKLGEFNAFSQILAYWRSKKCPIYGENIPATWVELYKDFKARIAA